MVLITIIGVTVLGIVGDHPWQLSPVQMFKLEWVHCTMFKHVLEAEGGIPHIFKLMCRVGSDLTKNITTPWLHLASWNLLDSQLS